MESEKSIYLISVHLRTDVVYEFAYTYLEVQGLRYYENFLINNVL